MIWFAAAVLLLAATAILLLTDTGAAGVRSAQASSARMQVMQDEWYLRPSRDRVKAGIVRIEVVNIGEDDHDLAVSRRLGNRVKHLTRVRTLTPGNKTTTRLRLKRGKYVLWCTLPGHKKLGMRATVVAGR